MVWREWVRLVAVGLLGWVVGRLLSLVVFMVVGAGVMALTGGVSPDVASILFTAVTAGFPVSGVVIGVLAWRRHPATVREVFGPTRAGVAASVGLALPLVGVASLFGARSFMVHGELLGPRPSVVVGAVAQFTLLFYPFMSLTRYLYRRWGELPRRHRRALLALAIVLNPVFVVSGVTYAGAWQAWMLSEPCGAEIRSVTPGSPGDRAGLAPPERITRIEDTAVNTVQDVIARMNRTVPGSRIVVRTNTSVHTVQLEPGSTRIGLTITTAYCRDDR